MNAHKPKHHPITNDHMNTRNPKVPGLEQLIKVKLKQIAGVHSNIAATYQKLMIPPFRLPFVQVMSASMLLVMLARNPILVTRERGQLRCIGNIKMYIAAKVILSQEDEFNCIEVFNTSNERIQADFISELIYLPAISGNHFSEVKILAEVARRAVDAQIWHSPSTSVDSLIAHVFGVDRRQLTQKLTTKMDDEVMTDNSSKSNTVAYHPGSENTTSDSSAAISHQNEAKETAPIEQTYELLNKAGVSLGRFIPANPNSLDLLIKEFGSIQIAQP